MSLFCWRLLLPVMLATGAPLLVSIAISLVSGLGDEFDGGWSIGRTAGFLPFFVLGHLYGKSRGVRVPAFNVVFGLVLLLSVGALAFATRGQPLQWLWGHTPYAEFGASWFAGMGLRALQLVLGIAGAVGLFMLIPKRPVFGAFGRQSLAIFISHIYVLKAMYALGVLARMAELQWPAKALCVLAASIVISLVCAVVGRIFPWAFDFTWLLSAVSRRRTPIRTPYP